MREKKGTWEGERNTITNLGNEYLHFLGKDRANSWGGSSRLEIIIE